MRTAIVLCVLGLMLGMCSACAAQETKRTAKVVEVNGTVEVKTPESKDWAPAKVEMVLNEGNVIRTKADSSALLNLDGEGQTATVEVKENSQMMLAELVTNKEEDYQKTMLDLGLGEVMIKAKKLHSEKSGFEIKTPTSIVAVRGTTFSVSVKALE